MVGADVRTRAKTTSDLGANSPSPRPSPIGWERENRPPSAAYPTTLEAADDASGCSLSRRTGEGQGEGRFIRNMPPVRHLYLHKPSRRNCAVEAVERVICRLRISELNNVAVAQNISLEVLPGRKVGGTLNPYRLRAPSLEFQLETTKSWIQQPKRCCYLRQIQIVDERSIRTSASYRVLCIAPLEHICASGNRKLIRSPADFTRPALQQKAVQMKLKPVPARLRTHF